MKERMRVWIKDFAVAARSLSRAPGFTLVTVATLALAIGATTAIFSVVEAVLLQGLPYPDADRLVAIRGTAPGSNLPDEFGVPDELYVQYREQATLLEDVATYGLFQSTTRSVVEDVMLDNFRRESPEPMVYVPRVVGSPAYVIRSPRPPR